LIEVLGQTTFKQAATMDKQITHHKSVNEKLALEITPLKRFKFARRNEQLSQDQTSLLDDLLDADIVAIGAELEARQPRAVDAKVRQRPSRRDHEFDQVCAA
jgi:hypothetical protein